MLNITICAIASEILTISMCNAIGMVMAFPVSKEGHIVKLMMDWLLPLYHVLAIGKHLISVAR